LPAPTKTESVCWNSPTENPYPKEFEDISKYFKANIIQGENPHFKTLETELEEYFEGKD
jgi:hypothetical protein